MKCAFCDEVIGSEREIVRNDLACAFPTYIPIVPGHILVVPLRHEAKFENLTERERNAVWNLAELVKKGLESLFGAEGYNFAWNEGKVGGQSVPHFHLHVLPRKAGDTGITEYNPSKFLYRPGERPISPDKEINEVARIIREHLNAA